MLTLITTICIVQLMKSIQSRQSKFTSKVGCTTLRFYTKLLTVTSPRTSMISISTMEPFHPTTSPCTPRGTIPLTTTSNMLRISLMNFIGCRWKLADHKTNKDSQTDKLWTKHSRKDTKSKTYLIKRRIITTHKNGPTMSCCKSNRNKVPRLKPATSKGRNIRTQSLTIP